MTTPTTEELLARRERLLGAGIATFYDDPVHIVRGEGVWLYDAGGWTRSPTSPGPRGMRLLVGPT